MSPAVLFLQPKARELLVVASARVLVSSEHGEQDGAILTRRLACRLEHRAKQRENWDAARTTERVRCREPTHGNETGRENRARTLLANLCPRKHARVILVVRVRRRTGVIFEMEFIDHEYNVPEQQRVSCEAILLQHACEVIVNNNRFAAAPLQKGRFVRKQQHETEQVQHAPAQRYIASGTRGCPYTPLL